MAVLLLLAITILIAVMLQARRETPPALTDVRFVCPDCGRSYRSRQTLRLHDQAAHDVLAQHRAKLWWEGRRA